MSVLIGIDPGTNGGLVALYPNGNLLESQIGITFDSLFTFMQFYNQEYPDVVIVCEDVNVNATMSKLSAGSFMRGIGRIEMLARCWNIPLHRVTPTEWKKYHGIGKKNKTESKADVKAKSIALAKRLCPTLKTTMPRGKKDMDGVCEAYLIAEYGRVVLKLGE